MPSVVLYAASRISSISMASTSPRITSSASTKYSSISFPPPPKLLVLRDKLSMNRGGYLLGVAEPSVGRGVRHRRSEGGEGVARRIECMTQRWCDGRIGYCERILSGEQLARYCKSSEPIIQRRRLQIQAVVRFAMGRDECELE